MTDVLVVGSVNLDLSASVARLPRPGETVTGATLERFPGGKGANQALAAKRLGANVQLIAAIGDDSAAEEALALLREDGVDLSHCVRDRESSTGIALIAVAESGENHIVVAPGANATLSADSIHFPPADALICQLEVPARTINDVADRFAGFFCANLAPARHIEIGILERADLLVVNEIESAWYGEKLGACTGLVAITFGADGAELRRDGELVARSPSVPVDAVDTTGAGDAFTAALTVALVEEMAPERALRFACAAGAVAATRRGAQPSLPTRAEVEKLLAQ